VIAPFESKPPATHARHPDGRRKRPKPRRFVDDGTLAALDVVATGHTELADSSWKSYGVWALDTANGSSWSTIEDKILPRSAADILFVQESKAHGDAGVERVRRTGRAKGWSCAASPARRTSATAEFSSGGCVVGAARGIGIRGHPDWSIADGFEHRFKLAWIGAILRGGLHAGSVYLQDSVGLNDVNLAVLQEVAVVLKQLRGPWVLAGDWNINPDLLRSSAWLDVVGGVLVAPQTPTCHGSTYDFFVVSQDLASSVVAVARVDDGGMHPHHPVRMLLRGDARRKLTRQLVRPKRVPGVLPAGPLPCPPPVAAAMPTEVKDEVIDQATDVWMKMACDEWSSLLGHDIAPTLPRFVWRSAVSGPVDQHLGANSMSAYWRSLAGRLDDVAAILERRRPGGGELVTRHFVKARMAINQDVWQADEVLDARAVVDAAIHAANVVDVRALRVIAATSRRKGKRIEDAVRRKKAACWRQALSVADGPAAHAASRPSRLAYSWVRGSAGWQQSPIGRQSQEDAVPDEAWDDETPDAGIIDSSLHDRVWRRPADDGRAVLSDQADIEAEADTWAGLWEESEPYGVSCLPPLDEPLRPLLPAALRQSAMTFAAHTGMGADNFAPRAVARLSDSLIMALCSILTAAELLGGWPRRLWLVLIVLLPKTDGGRRPIGLFPGLIRIWSRARRMVARSWEAAQARPYLYGGECKGAQRAAWQAAFKAETAALRTRSYAESLLDLVKAFEKVPHGLLVLAAERLGYSTWLLRMSLAAYRLRRSIGVDAVYSRLVTATCGITAGSTFATTELRLLLIGAIDMTCSVWCSVEMFVYVDDMTVAAVGDWASASALVAGATDMLVAILQDDLKMVVSLTKSVVVGSSFKVAKRVQQLSLTGKVLAVRATKLLGTPCGGGRRRAIRASRIRVRKFAAKVKRIHQVRKVGGNTRLMVRTAGTPALTYGVEVMGMSDTHLQSARVAIASALAPAAGGKNPDAVLLALDSCGATADPAFDAHALPLRTWALAYWQQWQAPVVLDAALCAAVASLQAAARTPWDKVAGPVSALVASVWRLGWSIISPQVFRDDLGRTIDVTIESPAQVGILARRSVRRWQLSRLAQHHPALIPHADDSHLITPDTLTILNLDATRAAPDRSLGAASASAAGLLLWNRFCPPVSVSTSAFTARLPTSVINLTDVVGRLVSGKRGSSKMHPAWDGKCRSWLLSAFSGGQWPQVRVAQAAGDEATMLCQLCGGADGTLEHRHCCPATVPEGGWPQPPTRVAAFLRSLDDQRRALLVTRGLFALNVEIPLRSPDGWWRWQSSPPADVPDDATWFIDGSLVDGPRDLISRCGFAIAVVGSDGRLIACGLGVPPDWVTTAGGAELWAFYTVVRLNAFIPFVITDCLSILQTLERGLRAACGPARPQARLWKLIAAAFDFHIQPEVIEERVIWMPSHTSRASIGRARRSDGRPISGTEWRANRLVDGLAKRAAHSQRVPATTRRLLQDARDTLEFCAAQVGCVTFAANNLPHTVWREDGTAVTQLRRDSLPPNPQCRRKPTHASSVGRASAAHPAAATTSTASSSNQEATTLRTPPPQSALARARAADGAREDRDEARFLKTWHKDMAERLHRPAVAQTGPTARERLEALRMRIRTRDD